MAQAMIAEKVAAEVPKKLVKGVEIIGKGFKDAFSGKKPFFGSIFKMSQNLAKNAGNVLSSAAGAGDVFKDPAVSTTVNDTSGGGITPQELEDAVRRGTAPALHSATHVRGPGLAFVDPQNINVPQTITTARRPAFTIVNNFSREFPVTGLDTGGLQDLIQNTVDTIVEKPKEGQNVIGFNTETVPTGAVKRKEPKPPKRVSKAKPKPKKGKPEFVIV